MPFERKTNGHLSAFVASALLHIGLAAILAIPGVSPGAPRHLESPRYTVQLLRMEIPRRNPEKRAQDNAGSLRTPRLGAPVNSPNGLARRDEASKGSGSALASTLPAASLSRQAVRQTLVRFDVPPGLTLRQEVPMPNLLMALAQKLPVAPSKAFVRPPARAPEKAAPTALGSAPDVDGVIPSTSVVKTLSQMSELPKLPVRQPSPAQPRPSTFKPAPPIQLAPLVPSQVTQTAPPPVNVLALSGDPALPRELLVIPPANQIAVEKAGGGVGTGGETGGIGGRSREGGNGEPGSKGAGTGGEATRAGSGGSGDGNRAKSGPASPTKLGLGTGGTGLSASLGAGAGIVGNSGGGAASGGALDGAGTKPGLPGTIQLKLPRDGNFGVVVSGSSAAASYPESSGALSGKLVYTVYLRVGQKKNWILQYCLPKMSTVSAKPAEEARASLEAPWPYYIVRPENAGDTEYALVHGMVTLAGKLDQLSVVFPQDLSGKDILLQSLQQWTFRPAKQNGEVTAVEVLLIIPRQN